MLADLAIRGHLHLGRPPPGDSVGWLLTARLAAAPPQGAGPLAGCERVLLRGLAAAGSTIGLPALPGAVLDQTRSELIGDAVRRGRFHGHPRHHATSQGAAALSGRILAFRRDLLHLQSQGTALAAGLLPYALHFGMAPQDQPLARFARASGAVFAGPGGWYLPLPGRSEYIDALHRGELITSADAGWDSWPGCWPARKGSNTAPVIRLSVPRLASAPGATGGLASAGNAPDAGDSD